MVNLMTSLFMNRFGTLLQLDYILLRILYFNHKLRMCSMISVFIMANICVGVSKNGDKSRVYLNVYLY